MQQVIYQICEHELRAMMREMIGEAKTQLEAEILAQKTEKYLSTAQVCEMISCDPSTIWRHCQRGYLTPIFLGGKKRFKLSDIRKIMEGK